MHSGSIFQIAEHYKRLLSQVTAARLHQPFILREKKTSIFDHIERKMERMIERDRKSYKMQKMPTSKTKSIQSKPTKKCFHRNCLINSTILQFAKQYTTHVCNIRTTYYVYICMSTRVSLSPIATTRFFSFFFTRKN